MIKLLVLNLPMLITVHCASSSASILTWLHSLLLFFLLQACSMQMSPFLNPPHKFNAAGIVVVMTLSLTVTFLTFQCKV